MAKIFHFQDILFQSALAFVLVPNSCESAQFGFATPNSGASNFGPNSGSDFGPNSGPTLAPNQILFVAFDCAVGQELQKKPGQAHRWFQNR